MSLPVLHQDAHLVVVHKPAGLFVHRTALDRHVETVALQQVRDQIGQHVYPVHRLDRPTSGALIFALNSEAARHLATAFAEQAVDKRYLAVVRGHPHDQHIGRPLIDKSNRGMPGATSAPTPEQPAETRLQVLATAELPWPFARFDTLRCALVEARPIHGRRHQIRRHLKGVGHPILGDVNHGNGRLNRFVRDQAGIDRLMLHCASMTFNHPAHGDPLTVHAPLDPAFQSGLQTLELTTEH